MSITIPTDMILGVPVGPPSAAPVMRKAARIWWHTQSKIIRKCSDAQAAATFATRGQTSEAVTDSLFTEYGFPWARDMMAVLADQTPACASLAFHQAGRAARDWIKEGADKWKFYLREVDAACAPGIAEQVMSTYEEFLRRLAVTHRPPGRRA